MKLIDPFKEPEYNYSYNKRFKDTVKFVVYPDKKVLVVGGGPFEKMLEDHWCKIFDYVNGFDLNWTWKINNKYDTILCFQVIEHLMNPLMFLSVCKQVLQKNGILYISYPTHSTKWFCHSGHYSKKYEDLCKSIDKV